MEILDRRLVLPLLLLLIPVLLVIDLALASIGPARSTPLFNCPVGSGANAPTECG